MKRRNVEPRVSARHRERQLTLGERSQLSGQVFRRADLSGIDFSFSDLRDAWLIDVVLAECDFSGADLRGAGFLGCDLRRSCFFRAKLGRNEFAGSCLIAATGLGAIERELIERSGGIFLRAIAGGRGRWR